MSSDNNYILSPETHEKYRQKIARTYLDDTSARDKPRAIILAGQPGAGKTGLSTAAVDGLSPHGGVVVVDTDALRARHPKYEQLTMENDRTAAGMVQKDAGQWADELCQDAMEQRRNLIIDGTLKNQENAQRLCQDLKKHGYEIEVHALAVSKEDSILGVYARYEEKKSEGNPCRWVPEAIHDQAYDGLPKSLDTLDRGRHADRITVYKRGENGPVPIHSGRGASRALEKERDRERTLEELAVRNHAWNREAASPKHRDAGVMQRIRDRDPVLSESQSKRAAELATEARDRARNTKTRDAASPWTKHSTSPERQKHATKFRGKGR